MLAKIQPSSVVRCYLFSFLCKMFTLAPVCSSHHTGWDAISFLFVQSNFPLFGLSQLPSLPETVGSGLAICFVWDFLEMPEDVFAVRQRSEIDLA